MLDPAALGPILLDQNIIPDDIYRFIFLERGIPAAKIKQFLIDGSYASESEVLALFSRTYGMPVLGEERLTTIPSALATMLPAKTMCTHLVLPYSLVDQGGKTALAVATDNPFLPILSKLAERWQLTIGMQTRDVLMNAISTLLPAANFPFLPSPEVEELGQEFADFAMLLMEKGIMSKEEWLTQVRKY